MALSTWLSFADPVEHGLRDEVASSLERSGLCACASGESPVGVFVFDAVDERVLSLLRAESRRRSLLALQVGSRPASGSALWSLVGAGAFDVLHWNEVPAAAEDVACRLQRWSTVNALLDSPRVRDALVGDGPAWRHVMRGIVEAACFTVSSILITGESGTGKELIAQLIHDLDPRRDKGDFVVVDCTTVTPELSGSEFFGHERGAFTGAMSARDGAFALADRGTLFLDEVGELSPSLQAQLLRVVQEHKFKRVGSNAWQTTHLRLIAATNRDLERGVAEGSFRSDFFHRIAGWQCRTLPLRERKDDILSLARHFMVKELPDGAEVPIDASVQEFLLGRDYPGNVRDLRQLVTRICHRHAGRGPISIGDIPEADRAGFDCRVATWPESTFRSAVKVAVDLGVGMKDIGQAATELAIELALEREGGNLQRAATRLGVTDRALQMRRAGQRDASASMPVTG